jgi:hypothetical protein
MKHSLAAGMLALHLLCAPALAAWKEHPEAIQTVYQQQVPHTDRTGRLMTEFDADRSFFPLVLYHALQGEYDGVRYELKDDAAAGFNACVPYETQDPRSIADAAAAAKMQMIVHAPSDAIVQALARHPSLLAWYLDEEPMGQFHVPGMDGRFAAFLKRRDQIHALDPQHPVFPLDVPLIVDNAQPWWIKWNTAGDVSAHDNYPINPRHRSLSFEYGIPESVSLAARSVKESKPVWVCLPSFEIAGPAWPFNMPTTRQLRCMVYTAIVHGATGVMYFALDSHATRIGSVVGMSSAPRASYGEGIVAIEDQLRMSRDLWQAAAAINKQIDSLRPALLSPTESIPYQVDLDDGWPSITPEPIRTLLKHEPAGGSVMLLVNMDDAPIHVRVRCKGFTAAQQFEAAGAGQFEAQSDGFELTCTPYDARVIRLRSR